MCTGHLEDKEMESEWTRLQRHGFHVFVYFGEVWVPEPDHDLIVGLIVVQGTCCIAYAVSGEGELVRRVDLLWGRRGELVGLC